MLYLRAVSSTRLVSHISNFYSSILSLCILSLLSRFLLYFVILGRPFVKRFALCYHTVVCLSRPVCQSVLSVTLVYCGQTVVWIKTKLGTQVGLGPGHIVLDGDELSLPQSGTAPPIFSPYLLWPNGWMNQDASWYGGRPRTPN